MPLTCSSQRASLPSEVTWRIIIGGGRGGGLSETMLGLISFDKFSQGAPLLHCMLGCNKVVHLVFFYERFIFYMTVVTGKTAHYYYQNYYYYYYYGHCSWSNEFPQFFFFILGCNRLLLSHRNPTSLRASSSFIWNKSSPLPPHSEAVDLHL